MIAVHVAVPYAGSRGRTVEGIEGWEFEAGDPSVGIPEGGWMHTACDLEEPMTRELCYPLDPSTERPDEDEPPRQELFVYVEKCQCGAILIIIKEELV